MLNLTFRAGRSVDIEPDIKITVVSYTRTEVVIQVMKAGKVHDGGTVALALGELVTITKDIKLMMCGTSKKRGVELGFDVPKRFEISRVKQVQGLYPIVIPEKVRVN